MNPICFSILNKNKDPAIKFRDGLIIDPK